MTARPRRRGMATVLGLLLLFVLSAIGTSAIRQWQLTRRGIDGRETHLQSVWLARSGQEIARSKLAESADYRGESVSLFPGGTVEIRVETAGERRFRATVIARNAPPAIRPQTTTLVRLLKREANGSISVESVGP